jgi:hypothetical protein
MNTASSTRLILAFIATLLLAGCETGGGNWHADSGVRDSDPHLNGPRDMNYDHVIVPGDRIGPVSMGGRVEDAIQHLGEPDKVNRSTFRGPGYNADEVYYFYKNECIRFVWIDSGVSPVIESGWRGINVTCSKWSTRGGVHVGLPLRDALRLLANDGINRWCETTNNSREITILTLEGVWLEAPNRNGNVTRILVMPRQSSFAEGGYKSCD